MLQNGHFPGTSSRLVVSKDRGCARGSNKYSVSELWVIARVNDTCDCWALISHIPAELGPKLSSLA